MVDPEKLNESTENAEPIFEVSPEDEKRMRELEEAGYRELREEANEARKGEPDAEEVARITKVLKAEIESEFDNFPNREAVFKVLGVEAENCNIGQERRDEAGKLYRLDFNNGGVEYDYMGAGEFKGSHQSPETYICETTPTKWPKKIYSHENGVWKDIR